jgi:hypothetical protein
MMEQKIFKIFKTLHSDDSKSNQNSESVDFESSVQEKKDGHKEAYMNLEQLLEMDSIKLERIVFKMKQKNTGSA